MHRLGQLVLARTAGFHEASAPRGRADLGDDHEIVAIRVQRLADDLVGDVRAVVVARVDVVDAALDRLAQHGDGLRAILRRSEDTLAGELHGAVAEAVDRAVAEGERAGFFKTGHDGTPLLGHPSDRSFSLRDNGGQSVRPVRFSGQCGSGVRWFRSMWSSGHKKTGPVRGLFDHRSICRVQAALAAAA